MKKFITAMMVCAAPAMAREQAKADPTLQQSGCEMTAFAAAAFGGANWVTAEGWSYLGDDWSGKIGSLKIKTGVWRFFEAADFQGDHVDLAPGEYKTLREKFQGKIGSVICIQQT